MNGYHIDFDAYKLDLVIRTEDAVIFLGDAIFYTKMGNEFCHQNQRLLQHVITDLQFAIGANDEQINSFRMLAAIIDGKRNNLQNLPDEYAGLTENDHFIHLKKGKLKQGLENISDSNEFITRVPYVNLLFWSNSSILLALNQLIAEEMNHLENNGNLEDPLDLLLQQTYLHCSYEEKTLLQMLSALHQSGFVLPLLLVCGKITTSEYAKALYSLKIISDSPENWMHKLATFTQDAMVVKDFLSFFKVEDGSVRKINQYIKEGEGDQLEFKSTLRWDLKAGKTNQAIERSCLKTITAFLNTHGGTLLIGVRDDGTTEGIESDKFVNEDKFLLHLWTLIRTCLGRDVSPYLRSSLEKTENRTVCIVRCTPCNRPVFLRQPGFNEEFYIRVGPGSTALDVSEALKYVADRFPLN